MLKRMVEELKYQDVELDESLTKSTLPSLEMKKSISKDPTVHNHVCPHCMPNR